MGFRFSIEHANWLAHILQPVGATPRLEHEVDQQSTLHRFVETFEHNLIASRPESKRSRSLLGEILDGQQGSPMSALMALRGYFQNAPWVALLLPSGTNEESDNFLTNRSLLTEMTRVRPDSTGVVLQLEAVPRDDIVLDHVFPAFKVALADVTRWPGLLVWTPDGDAAFFELSKDVGEIRNRLRWLAENLSANLGRPDLQAIREYYYRRIIGQNTANSSLRILHLSDLHLGSNLARRRLDRVQTIIRSVVTELGEEGPIVPVVTGDLMDSPNEENLGDVRSFLSFLGNLGVTKPIVVLGNHDVREDGWLKEQHRHATSISSPPVIWMDDHGIGFACFDSVKGGRLARGRLGEEEMAHVGNALDQYPEKASKYTIMGVLHHHPVPVSRPGWYKQAWYERLMGGAFDQTEVLEDAEAFLEWLKTRAVAAVLHGHKHIPRFDRRDEMAIVGCGSTVGKVETANSGHTYMSLNVLTVDRSRGLLGCRLRAERIPGAGLEAGESHEIVLRSTLAPPRNS